MDFKLKGKRVLVTGGTRGIGRAIAETFAEEGADVALCARKKPEVDETVQALKGMGVRAFGEVVDIADLGAVKSWVENAAAQLGGIDVLICNASSIAIGNSETSWRTAFTSDVLSVQQTVAACKPHLEDAAQKTGDAAVVIISSGAAVEAWAASSYGAMKAAQIHLAKGLARDFGPKHVRINTVSPGTVYFKGGIWEKIERERPEYFKTMSERNPLGRMATAREIANAAVFLASPVSGYTTGANLTVDGSATSRVNF
ncbi:MAG: SDR family NAD(P)-dependent oxidoreductase [Hyphomonadaceae bacterium]